MGVPPNHPSHKRPSNGIETHGDLGIPILGRPPNIFLVDSQCSAYFLNIGFLACRSSQVVETGHPFIYAYILA
jgi:hypothetical protein